VQRRYTEVDAVVIETTGIARPAPVIQTILCEPQLRDALRLDAIIAVVDCKHALSQLSRADKAVRHTSMPTSKRTAHAGASAFVGISRDSERSGIGSSHSISWAEQIGYADRILLNKTDLVPRATIDAVGAAVATINPWAPRMECKHADVPIDQLLGIHSFDTTEALERHPMLAREPQQTVSQPTADHISTISLRLKGSLDEGAFNTWIGELLQRHGEDLLRMKGVLSVTTRVRRLVFHTVHMQFEGALGSEWLPHEPRHSRIVIIGHNISALKLQAGFERCSAA
jgi:G3E family GTPase